VKTIVIGLTGQTGAGKSTVAALLAGKGFEIIDGDKTAREITSAGSPVLSRLAGEFGADILNADGTLNRSALAAKAFASRDSTRKLNRITHPAITEKMLETVKQAEARGARAVVIDAAALLESGIADRCDIIAVVAAPEKIRLQRIIERDGIDREKAMARIRAQAAEAYYNNAADIIIRAYPPYSVEEETEKLAERIRRLSE